MLTQSDQITTRIRSYVIRGRRTDAQARAFEACWAKVGLSIAQGVMNDEAIFGRAAPCFLEIGFGSGTSLLALAQAQPEQNFIGIETHQPGIGSICMGLQQAGLTNLRLYHEDAVDVLAQAIPDASLDGVQIFFPDPWPKRRHRARRLVQPEFIALLVTKLKPEGSLHLATDWADYAEHMMQVLSGEPRLINVAGQGQFSDRSDRRPMVTKFEQRALREGRIIRDLQFKK